MNLNNINPLKMPSTLRKRRQWVLWKMAERSPGEAPTKIPFTPNGDKAKADDASTWSDFATVVNRHGKGGYDGIGYEFSDDDGLCGIDLDGCRNPDTGEVAEWARRIIVKMDSYAEVSPSKCGVKIFVIAKSPFTTGRKKPIKDAERICDKAPAIEVYDHGRYFAVTGWKLNGPEEPQARQKQLDEVCSEVWPEEESPVNVKEYYSPQAVIERARKYLAKMEPAVSGQAGHDIAYKTACRIMHGFGLSESDTLGLLQEWNQSCQPPWSERELLHKVKEATKATGPRNYLRNVTPTNWEKVNLPTYEEPPPKHEPKLTTLAEAAANYVSVLRKGGADLIEFGIGDVDYALGGGIEPGELVVIAARPSHGKSAVALQCVHMWTEHRRPCLMISEEMSAMALGKRTLQFISDIPQEHWRTSLKELDRDVSLYLNDRAPAIVAESCGTTEAAIEQIDKAVKEHKIQIAVVDYAQLLRSPGKSRYEQVTNTSISLKQSAARHGIVVLMLCQLSRVVETRNKFLPVMSDIKDSGQIEQDADVIMFVAWPHRLDSSKPPHEFMFFIAKNRNRAINQGTVMCRFLPSRQMILHPSIKEKKNYNPAFDGWNNQDEGDVF